MRAHDVFRLLLPCTMLLLLYACGEREAAASIVARAPEGALRPRQDSARLATIQSGLTDALATLAPDATVPVIIHFREPAPGSAAQLARPHKRDYRGLLPTPGPGLTVRRRYGQLPAVAAHVTQAALERLRLDPTVELVLLDGQGSGQLKEAVPAIGADKVHSVLGLTGKGVRVAVLDTGIVTQHPDLKSSLIAQHCFTQGACPPGFASEGTSAEDDHGHGSNVAGILTSDGVVSSVGFAPSSELIAVKINDSNDSGYESDWAAGLDWVFENLATNKVQIVNMSIGTTAMHAPGPECDSQHPLLAKAVNNLVSAGVVVFAASGNSGSSTSIGAPACLTGVIAVGAVYDSSVGHQPPTTTTYSQRWPGFGNCGDDTTSLNTMACFTNSNTRLDVLAPGAPILSDSLRNMTESYWGTSQASPAAAGVAALMLECNPKLTPAEVKQTLVSTGSMVTDTRNKLSFPSVRALPAVHAACPQLDNDGGAAQADDDGGTPDDDSADASASSRDAGNHATRDASARDASINSGGTGGTATRGDAAVKKDSGAHDDNAADDGESNDDGSGDAVGTKHDSGGCGIATSGGDRDEQRAWLLSLALSLSVVLRRSARRFRRWLARI